MVFCQRNGFLMDFSWFPWVLSLKCLMFLVLSTIQFMRIFHSSNFALWGSRFAAGIIVFR